MLYSRTSLTQTARRPSPAPVLVFLHGLLGNTDDWMPVLAALPEYDWLAIDLPGHGGSASVTCRDFADCCQRIQRTIASRVGAETPIWLIGYSLGGRIAMTGTVTQAWAGLNLQGLLIEGGNFGLSSHSACEQRWQHDNQWALRFRREPIEQVLTDWYQQTVFSSLNHEQRQTLVTRRSANLGSAIADMLLATSLAHQPYLLPMLQQAAIRVWYVCGAKDEKFRQLAEHSGLNYRRVGDAGHNVHHEQPTAFADIIKDLINPSGILAGHNNNGNHHG